MSSFVQSRTNEFFCAFLLSIHSCGPADIHLITQQESHTSSSFQVPLFSFLSFFKKQPYLKHLRISEITKKKNSLGFKLENG